MSVFRLGVAGLAGSVLVLVVLSSLFPYGAALEATPWAVYVAVSIAAGAIFLYLVSQLPAQDNARRVLLTIFLVGLALRLAMFASLPVFEDDWHRYLWDGAAVAHGINPYAFPPSLAAPVDAFGAPRPISDDPGLARLQAMAAQAPEFHHRINHPYVSTIYPPLTQAAFGLAHWISPFSLSAWRFVLLLADIAAFWILLQLLREAGRPLIWSAVYWLNPLVITQVFGAGHMDGLLVPFLLAALWMGLTHRPGLAGTALAAAVGVKLWPVLLFPALAMRFWHDWRHLLRLSVVFSGLTLILLAPQALNTLRPSDGLVAYSTSWQTHALLFPLIRDLVFGLFDNGDELARLLVGGLVFLIAIVSALKFNIRTGNGLVDAWVVTIGALLFLSPTGYPWYVVWVAPFLALIANRGLLLLSLTGPLYYLRFVAGNDDPLYLWLVVPLAFLPALYLFVRDARSARVTS